VNAYVIIPIDMIDPNPYQIRDKKIGLNEREEMVAAITVSALKGRHGILQSPMVRMKEDGRFETVYGHGRIRAAKVAGIKELECRVESDVTDREMRLYMGQENLLRSDLTEKERMAWLEQVREDEGLETKDYGFLERMHEKTSIPVSAIKEAYLVNKVRKRLLTSGSTEYISLSLIIKTKGLKDPDQDKLIIKTMEKGWSVHTAFKIVKAVKDIEPELRAKLLDKKTDLPWKVIVALAEIEIKENALKILEYILKRRLTEKASLTIIEDAKNGIYPTYNVTYSNQFEDALRSFRVATMTISGWGEKKYELVKDHWDVIEPLLTIIEEKIQEFRRLNRRVQ